MNIIKVTKKQIQAMKNLYNKSDVEALEKLINLHWKKVEEIINNEGDSAQLAQHVVTVFQLAFNEQMRMLSTFEPNAYERTLNDVQDKDVDQKEFSKLIFKDLESSKQNFAFGQAFHSMDQLISSTMKKVRALMRKYPQYEEAIRTVWKMEH
ncbi:hypothetical protein [Pseudoramibacter sp.]|uniref:hypothetical protein n=1 Tax=Pseudoramibacter sp. TaxID=2034862 RepID=UPI0025DE9AD7|nr:hypothetical protein [Pseudoramibacter sp.]MCH4072876.1 hypothetical protein [Pseudoramibacter sp.]MCH4106647.1 hypothetical protein [Pseudoramibacter sp.]